MALAIISLATICIMVSIRLFALEEKVNDLERKVKILLKGERF